MADRRVSADGIIGLNGKFKGRLKKFSDGLNANSEVKMKKTALTAVFVFGAQEKTRTSTPVRILAPEASASTNSATWAI